MHFALRRARIAVGAIASLLAFAPPAQAQNYPNCPITIVSLFAAGGPSDAVGGVIAQSMSENLGQTVLVDNTAGAGGTIGTAKVARAQPPTVTCCSCTISAMPRALRSTTSSRTARSTISRRSAWSPWCRT